MNTRENAEASTTAAQGRRKRESHIWDRQGEDHYVEPPWCSERLFAAEKFRGHVNDPACGFGVVVGAARRAGLEASGCDIVYRNFRDTLVEDFFTSTWRRDNVVCNPPFSIAGKFVLHALKVTTFKVAIIFPTARLNAAHWLAGTPLRKVWLLSPRPSMPPGHVIAAGEKPGGGKVDYCWLTFTQGWMGPAEIGWLYRDGGRPCR